jgi:hypothetical protein
MANYSSYKKLTGDELADGSVDAADLTVALNAVYGVKWFYGSPGACTPGCCCLWTVPTGVKKIHIQMWGAGGNGSGMCSCNRCHHYMGSGGGYYNTKTIDTAEGCQYTVLLLVFIAAIQENVQVVKDVHRMLMVITYLTFVPLVDREVDHKHHGQLYVPLVGAVA